MKCIECDRQFHHGEYKEVEGGVMCWACVAHLETEARKAEEEEAFATLSTNELVHFGYISEEVMAELMTPWGDEMPIAA